MSGHNHMKLSFASRSENEAFARISVAAFVTQLDPTMEQLDEIKTVVSEAVTNAIIHGYNGSTHGIVTVEAEIDGDMVSISISDQGGGIEDLELARQPLYTSRPELERSGMGFTIMENFMDEFDAVSTPEGGTTLRMKKRIESKKAMFN
ncbi:anti-sigma F factor [Cohnella kolymensis]|uniref:Anti-sigma F factor n=1 Tax=Cohnella kolymensis TaxID=1590652 RepID=A0ABR5A2W5_9BACL|nr:anti-sigma F factor [Cohnella kolymensis]KIL34885.1 anti-sigma F factor [Cohnella kolymensis]